MDSGLECADGRRGAQAVAYSHQFGTSVEQLADRLDRRR